jgi:hypothetical protein
MFFAVKNFHCIYFHLCRGIFYIENIGEVGFRSSYGSLVLGGDFSIVSEPCSRVGDNTVWKIGAFFEVI